MNNDFKYIIGTDIGIGSVGWAVIDAEKKRIEDFGVRLFDSGEVKRSKRKSQMRRGFRSTRRLYRRRAHRIERLKNHFDLTGFCTHDALAAYYEKADNEPLKLRCKGTEEKLTREETVAAVLHIAKHRGYNDFYKLDEETLDSLSKEEKAEYETDAASVEKYAALAARYPADYTPAKVLMTDPAFMSAHGVHYRNTKDKPAEERILIPREALKAEAEAIFKKQRTFYPELTDASIEKAMDIIFSQRDFEAGPGDPNDPNRKYKGFLDTLGNCTFYHEERRGARYTVLGDLYILVNRLSQNLFTDAKTGEITSSPEANRAILKYALEHADISTADVKNILKPYGIAMIDTADKSAKKESLNQCISFIRLVKPMLEKEGLDWNALIAEDQYDMTPGHESMLNRCGVVLSENRTPARRVARLKAIPGFPEHTAVKLAAAKTSGTVSVCYRYMRDAIEAFCSGEVYGNFQARIVKDGKKQAAAVTKKYRKLPVITDEEYINNPVVLRSVNETRKVINAIIDKYGSPYAINIEIAADLSRSFDERRAVEKENRDNEKRNDAARKKIHDLMDNQNEVTPVQLERYLLGESQQWKCPYCGGAIDNQTALRLNDREYEIDHIVPFSLVLDNTKQNKVLVHSGCNQKKGQRTPLMYLDGEAKKTFTARVNESYKKGRISKKKFRYLMQPDIYDASLLSEWKSRNINDTRYIAKFMVRYISENLLFASEKEKNVFAVKGAVTSRMRRVWLNKDTWGDEKTALRENSCLHHAVDAVIIANCLPEYIELAEESMRCYRMYKEAGKKMTPEIETVRENAAERLFKYYGLAKARSIKMLGNIKLVPSLIEDLRTEVDLRFSDCDIADEKRYRTKLANYYCDKTFAESRKLPLVSYKPNRKFSGEITAANPLKKEDAGSRYCKQIGPNNTSVLDDESYYCTEIYKDTDGNTRMRGIKYTDLVKKGGKLTLRTPAPKGYAEHVMYLFKSDYIVVFEKDGQKKFEGYYTSVHAMQSQRIRAEGRYTGQLEKPVSILRNNSVKKYGVSILGELGGEIPCGRPFSFPAENG